MMNDNCILTTKDHSILEALLERGLDQDDPLVPLLRRKLAAATVVLRENVPADVATLNSRLSYHLDNGISRIGILCHAEIEDREGLFLPLATPRGLALLGLSRGQVFTLFDPLTGHETVTLDEVLFQQEAAMGLGGAVSADSGPFERWPEATRLHLVRQHERAEPVVRALANHANNDDDPGPSAA